MVYYGALSKGCQRCRQRKVKACASSIPCDQRRPGCVKCEKGKKPCPGYRNLTDIVFRDECQRIKNRFYEDVNTEQGESRTVQKQSGASPRTDPRLPVSDPSATSPVGILPVLCQTLEERAANFFFAYYTTTGPPFCDTYQAWLAQQYLEDSPQNLVRATIQAAGMAAISNIFNAPNVVLRAKQRYCQALKATHLALRDPGQVVADSTLMAILLLGLFEIISFENWKDYHTWMTHIEGAMALLRIRGQEQFSRELGIQLYVQFRNYILQACIQRGAQVPPALVEVTTAFEISRLGKRYNSIRPGSLALVGFRIVNLRADIKNHNVTDPQEIFRIVVDINDDLQAWASLQTSRVYYETEAVDDYTGAYFNGKRHIYASVWGAQVWNNWRSLSILTNQIMLDYVNQQKVYAEEVRGIMREDSLSAIRNLSTEICISTADLSDSPRASSMIWPLYIVSQEEINSTEVRSWAADKLHGIKVSLGINQAAVLADAACPNWREYGIISSMDFLP